MAKRLDKFLVGAAAKAETSKGKKYLRMEMYELGGRRWPAMMWEDREPPPVGSLVDCMVEEDSFDGTPQFKVHALRVLEELCANPDPYLPKSKMDVKEMWRELKGYVEEVAEPALRSLLLKVLDDRRWGRAPAAKTMHHAYLGGLLDHVVGLARLARAAGPLYGMDQGLLLAGAVLHDLGKMEEMACAATIEYTTPGKLLGHVPLGYERVLELMSEDKAAWGTRSEPTVMRLQVLHIIGSHHGNKAYGAFQTPAFREAQFFSDMDGMDANQAKMASQVEAAGEGKEWTAGSWKTPEVWVPGGKKAG